MLTKDEKLTVSYYLASRDRLRGYLWYFVPFLVPPIAFAVYGYWKQDFNAIAFAFVVLLVFALWYVLSQYNSSRHLLAALRKYEDVVRALDKPDANSD